jgi:uncharacterized phage infection (PIP) family protein YhgE
MSAQKTAGATRVPVTVDDGGDSVQKAMDQVTNLVNNIAKAAGLPAPGEAVAEPVAKAAAAAPVVAPVAKVGRELVVDTFKSAGVSGEALDRAMAAYDAGETPVSKASAEDNLENTVNATLDSISKAKAFTPARVAKLKEAMDALQKLMMDVIPTGSSPSTSTPTVHAHGNPNTTRAALSSGDASVTKSVDEVIADLQKRIEGLTTSAQTANAAPAVLEQLATITKRLEAIEQTRLPGASTEETTPATPVQKAASFWNGAL